MTDSHPKTPTPAIPKVGSYYRKNGFEFRVDYLKSGEVYFVRWPLPIPEDQMGSAGRVPIELWGKEMLDAEELANAD